ncbi:GntR family transcriptional regulator [marine actinobacterium PHSC20C1]|nr:GntR family transcriptional regulator [marine actinobacterium PHSC20C1]
MSRVDRLIRGDEINLPDVVFDKIKQGKLAEVIAAQIRDEIRSGALVIGDRLPTERELIEQLGVSRATVREALMLLESDGFVQMRAGRHGGAYVTRPKIERLATILDVILSVENTTTDELLEARALMEPLAVRLASVRATAEDLARIDECLARTVKHRDNPSIVAEEAARFHVLIAQSSHNGVISALTATTQQLIFSRAFDALGTEIDATIQAHQRIFAAIRDKQPDVAARRMMRHIGAFETVLENPHWAEFRHQPGDA